MKTAVFSGILHRRAAEKARGITAGDLMTAAVVTVAPQDTVSRAARLMYTRRVQGVVAVRDRLSHLSVQ